MYSLTIHIHKYCKYTHRVKVLSSNFPPYISANPSLAYTSQLGTQHLEPCYIIKKHTSRRGKSPEKWTEKNDLALPYPHVRAFSPLEPPPPPPMSPRCMQTSGLNKENPSSLTHTHMFQDNLPLWIAPPPLARGLFQDARLPIFFLTFLANFCPGFPCSSSIPPVPPTVQKCACMCGEKLNAIPECPTLLSFPLAISN